MLRLKWIFKIQNLMIAFIFFIILSVAGSILSKTIVTQISKGEFAKSSPGLQNKIGVLKEEIERLETTKANVMEDVAKKQKEQKDLEKEIESLKTKKVTMPSKAELETATAAKTARAPEKAMTKEEKEKSEEDLLFDKLLGGGSKTGAKKKEELELTQRIVAKRREEIALSGTIETRRKELMKLEQQIDKLKKQK